MHRQHLWPWLILTAIMMVVGVVIGVLSGNRVMAVASGGMFAMAATYAGQKFAELAPEPETTDVIAARYARLMATAYAWSGAAMLASYYLTELSWQHAWQYGLAMLVIAGALFMYADQRLLPGSSFATDNMVLAARWMTTLQGAAVLVGLVWLVSSGKLHANKQDWAANIVFVSGGMAIVVFSATAMLADHRARHGAE